MPALFQSRRFWVLVIDLVISISLYFLGKYGTPSALDDVKFLIAAIQPVVLLIISAYTVDTVQTIKAGK
jgi:hypothetical protein